MQYCWGSPSLLQARCISHFWGTHFAEWYFLVTQGTRISFALREVSFISKSALLASTTRPRDEGQHYRRKRVESDISFALLLRTVVSNRDRRHFSDPSYNIIRLNVCYDTLFHSERNKVSQYELRANGQLFCLDGILNAGSEPSQPSFFNKRVISCTTTFRPVLLRTSLMDVSSVLRWRAVQRRALFGGSVHSNVPLFHEENQSNPISKPEKSLRKKIKEWGGGRKHIYKFIPTWCI